MPESNKNRNSKILYKYMTITILKTIQFAENHAGYVKKKSRNVDILSVSYLIFAAEPGYFSTLAPIITV